MFKHIILSLLLALSFSAYADRRGDDRPKGGEQSQGQAQGQAQKQKSANKNLNANANLNANRNSATSTAGAKALGVGLGKGGDGGAGGDSKSVSGSNIDIDTGDFEAASSAASLYSVGCQVGASGQTQKGGVSLIIDDAACQALKMADAHGEALKRCAKDDSECREFHHVKVHEFLELAGDNVKGTEKYNRFGKAGVSTGLGSLGFTTLIYALILAL